MTIITHNSRYWYGSYTNFTIDKVQSALRSKKGLVVLCHGLGERSYFIKNLAQGLKDNFAVVRYDYNKHGYLIQ